EPTTDKDPVLSGVPSRHVEDDTIEQLAEVAEHTDDVAVRRQLFGWRELISTLIPLALIAVAARNVDWGEAARALGRAQVYFFVLLIVGGYVAFGRTILPDLFIVYLTGAALALLIVAGLAGMYFLAPHLARFFPAEVRRIGRLFREGVLHSFRALPVAGPLTVLVWFLETSRLLLVLFALGLYLPPSQVIFVAVASSMLTTVPLTPAGFGFVEIAMVYVLTAGFGLAQNDAVAVAVLDRAVSVFSVIVVGGVLYLRTQRTE